MADINDHNGHVNGHNRHNRHNNRLYAHEKQKPRKHLSEFGCHLVAASGEFVGTFLFLYFAYAGNVVAVLQEPISGPNGSLANNTVMYIAMAYGFSLLVNVWAFYRISGGLFNPAVSHFTFNPSLESSNSVLGHSWTLPIWSTPMDTCTVSFPSSDHGSILITTRLTKMEQLGEFHEVKKVDDETAKAILQSRYRTPWGNLKTSLE